MAKKNQKTDNQKETKATQATEETMEEKKAAAEKEENAEQSVEEEVEEAEKEAPEVEDDGAEPEEEAEEKSKEEELEEKLAAMNDKYMRLSAEYDNYRKRTLREKIDLQETARQDVFVQILPVIDDLERALASIDGAKDVTAVKEGMDLIYSKFTAFLNQQGVKPIDALNQELNTDHHEAVTKIKVDSKKKKGKVVDVIEKGYLLKDRVIRFAKVVIGE